MKSVHRRAQIVVEASELFASKGFAAVGVQEIGEKVGIAGGAIYRHFASKDELLHTVLLESIDAWLAAAAPHAEPEHDDPRTRLRDMVTRSVQLVVERPGQLATYLRERHRADTATRRVLKRREKDLFLRWSGAMLALRPELRRAEIALRQQVVNGVLGSLAQRPAALGQARFRALVVDGLLAVLAAPALPEAAADATPQRAWTPPRSRRQQILAVAMERFRERGYRGVGMDEIGDAAGLTGPSLYEYFDGKADILLDAYDRAGALVMAGAAAALAGAGSASEALDALVRSFAQLCFEHVDLIAVTNREGASLPAAERPRLKRRRRDLHETWSGVLRELRTELAPADARALVRPAIAAVLQVALHQDGVTPLAETAAVVRAFLMGSLSTKETM